MSGAGSGGHQRRINSQAADNQEVVQPANLWVPEKRSGFTRATATLREEGCVSAPYLGADLGILVPKANPHTVEAAMHLTGLTVAVLDGSEAERWALGRLDGSTIASLPATDDLLTALQQERADALVADLPFARFTQERSPAFTLAGRIDTTDGYVFVASKDNGPLIAQVDEAVSKLKGSGAFRKLERRWFG